MGFFVAVQVERFFRIVHFRVGTVGLRPGHNFVHATPAQKLVIRKGVEHPIEIREHHRLGKHFQLRHHSPFNHQLSSYIDLTVSSLRFT